VGENGALGGHNTRKDEGTKLRTPVLEERGRKRYSHRRTGGRSKKNLKTEEVGIGHEVLTLEDNPSEEIGESRGPK